jgi:hypothetical protein
MIMERTLMHSPLFVGFPEAPEWGRIGITGGSK